MYKPHGIISSLVTPFDADGRIDETAFRQLIDFQLRAGVDGIALAPNTGEFINLTPDEIRRLTEIAVDQCDGRAPITVGALAPGLWLNVEIARLAKEAGADAVLVGPPYYLGPSKDGLVDYFRALGDVGIPMIIYNHPMKTPYNIMEDTLERLLTIETFVAIKEVDPSMVNNAKRLAMLQDTGVSYLMGEENLAFYHFVLGGHGGFFALANLVPDMLVELWRLTRAHRMDEAIRIHMNLIRLADVVYVENYPAALKEGMALMGLEVNGGYTRSPLGGLSEKSRAALKRVLDELQLAGR